MRKVKVKRLDYKNRIKMKFSLYTLNIFISYTISNDERISTNSLMNIRKLLNLIDPTVFDNDFALKARFRFLDMALEAKLDNGLENPYLLIEHCRTARFADVYEDIIEDVGRYTLTKKEIKYVNNMVSDRLSHCFMYHHKDAIMEQLSKLDSGDFEDLGSLKRNLKKTIINLMTDMRKAEANQDMDGAFSLREGTFERAVTETVERLQNPGNILKTGIQALNEILAGGFQAQRFYMFAGLSGGFKSGLLLNLMYQIRLYNENYVPKDPSKVPAILMVTQENSVDETVERLYSLAVADDNSDELKYNTPQEAIEVLRKKGRLRLTSEHNIDIIVEYRAGQSIDTSDLYGIIEGYEDMGYEIICLFHDYIKRIRSATRDGQEERLKLGAIVDEMKALAIEKDIPVISANQLNREGAKTIDSAMEFNGNDLAKLLGRSNVGESWNTIENSDFACIINREMKQSTQRMYLTFKRIKLRGKPLSELTYFNQPFAETNTMRIETDLGKERLSEESLATDLAEVIPIGNSKMGRKNAKEREPLTFTRNAPSQDDRLQALIG